MIWIFLGMLLEVYWDWRLGDVSHIWSLREGPDAASSESCHNLPLNCAASCGAGVWLACEANVSAGSIQDNSMHGNSVEHSPFARHC